MTHLMSASCRFVPKNHGVVGRAQIMTHFVVFDHQKSGLGPEFCTEITPKRTDKLQYTPPQPDVGYKGGLDGVDWIQMLLYRPLKANLKPRLKEYCVILFVMCFWMIMFDDPEN
jgi:hypothetical protein